jgi:hypothetical protein
MFISSTFYILEVTYGMYNTLRLILSPPIQWNTLTIFIVVTANLIWAVLLVYALSHLAWQCEKLATEVKCSNINIHVYLKSSCILGQEN